MAGAKCSIEEYESRLEKGIVRCSCCKEYLSSNLFMNCRLKEKYPYCRICNRKAQNKSHRNIFLKNLNMTYSQYEEMKMSQENKCAICFSLESFPNFKSGEPIELAIDHCHSTNKVRGLLCRHCNLLLCHANDSIDILNNAIKYLLNNK